MKITAVLNFSYIIFLILLVLQITVLLFMFFFTKRIPCVMKNVYKKSFFMLMTPVYLLIITQVYLQQSVQTFFTTGGGIDVFFVFVFLFYLAFSCGILMGCIVYLLKSFFHYYKKSLEDVGYLACTSWFFYFTIFFCLTECFFKFKTRDVSIFSFYYFDYIFLFFFFLYSYFFWRMFFLRRFAVLLTFRMQNVLFFILVEFFFFITFLGFGILYFLMLLLFWNVSVFHNIPDIYYLFIHFCVLTTYYFIFVLFFLIVYEYVLHNYKYN